MNANDFIITIIEKVNATVPFNNNVDSAYAIVTAIAREVENGVKLPVKCTVKFQGENITVITRGNINAPNTIIVTVELPDTPPTSAFAKRPEANENATDNLRLKLEELRNNMILDEERFHLEGEKVAGTYAYEQSLLLDKIIREM